MLTALLHALDYARRVELDTKVAENSQRAYRSASGVVEAVFEAPSEGFQQLRPGVW